jgi:hypothetical protein
MYLLQTMGLVASSLPFCTLDKVLASRVQLVLSFLTPEDISLINALSSAIVFDTLVKPNVI